MDVDTLLFDCNTKYLCSDFFGCTPKHIVVGENVDSINGDNGGLMYGLNPAFKDKRLQSIILPSSMRIINEYAFDGCSSLQYVNLIELKDLEYLGVAAFRKTEYKPDTLYIPNTLTNNTYFLRSFSYKDGEHIYIGDNIKTISGYIPSHKSSSSSLSSLGAHVIFHVNQMTPPKVSYVGAQWASGSIVYVPKGAKALWESHENWKNGWCNIAYANSAPTIIEENTIEKVLLDKHELIIDVGESAMLLATPIPVDADDVSMMWFSKDETIATVSQTGNVKALSPGSTWIYAVSKVNDNVKDSCRITSIKHVTSIHTPVRDKIRTMRVV